MQFVPWSSIFRPAYILENNLVRTHGSLIRLVEWRKLHGTKNSASLIVPTTEMTEMSAIGTFKLVIYKA